MTEAGDVWGVRDDSQYPVDPDLHDKRLCCHFGPDGLPARPGTDCACCDHPIEDDPAASCGNRKDSAMTFEDVLPAIKQGQRAHRRLWETSPEHESLRGMVLELVEPKAPDGRPMMPQLLVEGSGGVLRPFAGANWDLLADDWELCQ
jgi:Protein of unknown function (DUF2829)